MTRVIPFTSVPVLMPCAPDIQDGQVIWLRQRDPGPERIHIDKKPVCVIKRETLPGFINPASRQRFEKKHGEVAQMWLDTLVEALGIADLIRGKPLGKMETVLETYVTAHQTRRKYTRDFPEDANRDPLGWVASTFNEGLKGIRFVVWWVDAERRLAPGLYCNDPREMLHALALSRIGLKGGLGVCWRCNKTFEKERGTQSYCSIRCQTASASARYRERIRKSPKRGNRKKKVTGGKSR